MLQVNLAIACIVAVVDSYPNDCILVDVSCVYIVQYMKPAVVNQHELEDLPT